MINKLLCSLFIFFTFFLSLNAKTYENCTVKTYPYDGEKALYRSGSKYAGQDHNWLSGCGGKAYKNASFIEQRVKEWSKPDYEIYKKEKQKDREKYGNVPSSGCNEASDVIKANNRYIAELKKRVDQKLCLIKEDTSKKENQTINKETKEQSVEEDTNKKENQTNNKGTGEQSIKNVQPEITISLGEAKQILKLVQEFLPSNPSEFDIVTLTTLIQKNKEILQDNWSSEQQEMFKELYDFLFQSDTFSNFKKQKDLAEQKAKQNAIKQEKKLLDQNISLLKDYLTKNMLSDDATLVLEMIKEGESLKSSENIERLKKINRKINSFLSEKNPKELNIQNDKNSSLNIENKINDVLNVFGKNDNKSDLQGLEDDQNFKAEKDNVVSNSYVNFEDANVYGPCAFGVCLYDKLEDVIKNKKTGNCKYENIEGICQGPQCWKGDDITRNLSTDSYDGKWCIHGDLFQTDLSLIFEMSNETNKILGSNFTEFQHALTINDEAFSAFKNVKSYCSLPYKFQGRFVSKGGHTVIVTALPDTEMTYFISDIFVQFNNFNEKVQTSKGHSEYQLKIFDVLVKRYETTFLNIRDQYDNYVDTDDYSRTDYLVLNDRLYQDNKSYNIRMWDGFDRNRLWGSPKHKNSAEILITNDVRYNTYKLDKYTEVEFNALMSSEEFDYLSYVASKISQSDYCRDLSQGPEVDID